MTLNRRQLLLSCSAALALPSAGWAQAKPVIRLLVGFPPGGATDAIARAVADKLPKVLGQPVIVENKPGAGGRMAADLLLASPADGLTFMVAPNATPTFQMLVFKEGLKWNSLTSFVPVASFASYPLGMGVAADLGVSTGLIHYFVGSRDALLAMSGAATEPMPLLRAVSEHPMRKKPGRTEYQRGIVSQAADGRWQVRITGAQGSGILRSMSQANGMVVLHHGQGDVAVGDLVDVIPFNGLI
mgnify:CR=1 FL=1